MHGMVARNRVDFDDMKIAPNMRPMTGSCASCSKYPFSASSGTSGLNDPRTRRFMRLRRSCMAEYSRNGSQHNSCFEKSKGGKLQMG
jgi:hypothetical protein